MAGCIIERNSQQLVIALEPEAASLFCRRLNLAQFADEDGSINFTHGTKYLVLDCGDGTIDMTVHILELDGKVKELYRASGGPWGGTKVDEKFVEFLELVLGKDFLNKYRQKCPHEWLQFLTNFEKMKKSFKADGVSKICISLPWSLGTMYAEVNPGKNIERVLKSQDGVSFASGLITLKYTVAKQFFDPICQPILDHVGTVLRETKLAVLKYIMIVGGFSESEYLQYFVKKEFERNDVRVLIPNEAQLAIIKGAVLFGHKPDEIQERIVRKFYGCAVRVPFDAKIHAISTKFTDEDGVDRCDNIVDTLVEKGQSMKTGSETRKQFRPLFSQESIQFKIYATDIKPLPNQKSVNDPDVTFLGMVVVNNLGKGDKKCLELILKFGQTELLVEAVDVNSGAVVNTTVDFLG